MSQYTGPVDPDLHSLLEKISTLQSQIGARQVLVTDPSGHVLLTFPEANERGAVMLGALSAGNLAAMDEMLRLSGCHVSREDPQTFIVEGVHGNLVLCRGLNGRIYIASLGKDAVLGLARIELRNLANADWLESGPPADLDASLVQGLLDSLDRDM